MTRTSRTAARQTNAVDQPPRAVNRRAVILSWLVGLVAGLVYLRTLSPGMQMGDGTELATCAYVLGVPHPTGYPLYMLVLKLWLLITMHGEVIVRTTLFNAIAMSAAAELTTRIAFDLLSRLFSDWSEKALLLAATAAGLSTAFLRFHWENAVVTEVYALEFLLMLFFLRIAQRSEGMVSLRSIAALSLLAGLGLAHHRMSVFLLLPLLWLSLRAWKQLPPTVRTRATAISTLLLFAPLALYFYLPIRAASAPLHWGNTRTLAGFIEHVRGSEYLARSFMRPAQGRSFTADTYLTFAGRETAQIAGDFVGQLAPVPETYYYDRFVERIFLQPGWRAILLALVLAPIAIFGGVLWRRTSPQTFLVAALVSAQNVLVLYIYNILDIRDYYLFPMWFAWMCVWIGLLGTVRILAQRRQLVVRGAAYTSLLAPLAICSGNFHRCDQSSSDTAEQLSATILPNLPQDHKPAEGDILPNAILLTGSDYDSFTSWYRQLVRGERKDVLIFASNFIWKPWYPFYFSDEQKQKFHLKFAPHVAQDVVQYVDQLASGIIDANIATTPIYTSISDQAALAEMAKRYILTPINQVSLQLDRESEGASTIVLYRIRAR